MSNVKTSPEQQKNSEGGTFKADVFKSGEDGTTVREDDLSKVDGSRRDDDA